MDNSRLYVTDRHNIGIGGALDIIVSQHLIMALDVVLIQIPSELGHHTEWVSKLVKALRLLKHMSIPVGGVTFVDV